MTAQRILVTGGGGFLGRFVCRDLVTRGYSVVSFSRGRYPLLERLGVACRQGDLGKLDDVQRAMAGCNAVFHTAARAEMWGRPEGFLQTNVLGTRNVLRAMKEHGIRDLVYTSSPSVVFDGRDIINGDESLPFPRQFKAEYPRTKMMAEQLVQDAHADLGLRTVVLRPHLIWGPGDPHFIPRLREKSRSGKLVRVGQQKNLVDVIYVENASRAHVDAYENLVNQGTVNGRVYFIAQEHPVNLWEFVDQLLTAIGEKPTHKRISYPVAYGLGHLAEFAYKALGIYDREPPVTRWVADQLARSHYFNHQRAHADFGYTPAISLTEGLSRLRQPDPFL